MTPLLNIENLSVSLQDKVVLSSLDLQLNEGEILGLVGASGCGKTTLLNAIAGFNQPSQGKVTLGQNLLSDQDTCLPAELRHVGMIFQDYALFPHLTVKQNIAFGISNLSKTEQDEQVKQLLGLLKLSGYEESYIHQLSGGQQQRVAIARALAPKPKLLLLDEPFSNIDSRLRNELMVEIRQLLKQLNTTAIFVTHNKDEVFTFADKMAVMANGKMLQFDAPSIICQSPNSYQVADFLQLGSWLPCSVSEGDIYTALGLLDITELEREQLNILKSQPAQLLIKPQHILLTLPEEGKLANAKVDFISVTEQGYHYYLSNLEHAQQAISHKSNKVDNTQVELAFNKLSVYSDMPLKLDQQVNLSVNPHPFIFFNNQ